MATNLKHPTFASLKPKVVLGVAAHPDDLEYWAGGSIAMWADQGADIYFLVLTNGNKGIGDHQLKDEKLQKARQVEQQESAKLLGVKQVIFKDYEDGSLQANAAVRLDIVRAIRRLKPDVVVTIDPTLIYASRYGFINHTDHRAAGQATLDAVYPFARNHLSFPELLESENLEPHSVATVLLANFAQHNFCVDIGDLLDKKIQAWEAHKTQANVKATCDTLRYMAQDCGSENKVHYAEGFMRIDIT